MSIARSTPAQKPRGFERRICMRVLYASTRMSAALDFTFRPAFAALTERVDQQAARADRYRRVGNVERREVPIAPMEVDEIDDIRMPDAVDHVPERSAEHERETDRENQLLRGANLAQPQHEHDADDDREPDEKPALPAARVVQHAERGTAILQIDDIEKRQE